MGKDKDRDLKATVSGKVYSQGNFFCYRRVCTCSWSVIGIVDGDGNTYEGVVNENSTLSIEVPVERNTDE